MPGEPGSLVGTRLVLPEITDYALPIALVAFGVLIALAASALTERVPVPAPVLFLLGAAVLSDLLPKAFGGLDITSVERIAVIALIVILLNGGMDIGSRRLRASLADVSVLGVLGTFATAAGGALVAHLVLGLEWRLAAVVGAALAPTDPAVVFSVLGRREIAGRSGTVLEGEAGANDPAGIALLLGMVEVATAPDGSLLGVVGEFALEMGIGAAVGVVGALVLIRAQRRVRLPSSGQYPVLVLAGAAALYGVATELGGSGFLAVFTYGLLLADVAVPYRGEVETFTGGLASLAEIAVFLVLGLTVTLGDIALRDWLGGLAVFALLTFVLRPLVVAVCLARSSLVARERAFVAFAGLKGAVPILLAAFAVLGGVPQADRIYDVVFVVVLLSVGVQGTLVPTVAERLRIPMTVAGPLPWGLSVGLAEPPRDHLDAVVEEGAAAAGRPLAELPMGEAAWATLVVREDRALPARPDLQLEPGDRVYVLGAVDADALLEALADRR